jgi:drug/metabolite transporter (DMT)-like permease
MSVMAALGFLFTVLAGLVFYRLRCRHQFWYGVLEIVVGIVIIFLTWFPQTTVLIVAEPSFFGYLLSKGTGILAGVYILVRGLDNMERGLPQDRRSTWQRIFYGKMSS